MTRQQRQEGAPHSQTPVAQSSFPAPLSPHWAFVVQLREGAALTAAAIHGRVEHIVSGRQAFFNSLDELRVFMEQVLTEGKEPPR